MTKKFQSIKGFYDVLPERQKFWRFFEGKILALLDQYYYEEIGLPIVEETALFEKSVGSHTDIVEKEMYSWEDKLNENRLTLRPEGTAGCVRALIQNNLAYNGPIKLFYRGPMFRHENVQKGRQRQFNQFGVEAFGLPSFYVDAEQIIFLNRLWAELGLKNITLELNSIGDSEDRVIYKKKLVDYFEKNKNLLDADALKRIETNPLRILDSKNPKMQDLLSKAPKIIDYLSKDAKDHFDGLCALLSENNISYKINNRLVRGLDYYNRTVFEWITKDLGSQGAVAGGGRYDLLVENLGGSKTFACGFGVGIERIILLLEGNPSLINANPDIYIINLGDKAKVFAFSVSEVLRESGLKVALNMDESSFKSQMKKADKSNAELAIIIGDDEVEKQVVQVKYIRSTGSQETILNSDLIKFMNNYFI